MFSLVDIENNYLILCQFGYFLPFLRFLNSRFQWLDLDLWLLICRGHLGSKIFPTFENPYMTSYLTSIDTFSLSRTVFEIFDFKVISVWPRPLTCRGHPRSKIFSLFESPYMTSYLFFWHFLFISYRFRLRSMAYNILIHDVISRKFLYNFLFLIAR